MVQDGRIEEREVRLGLRTLGAAEVRTGLADGDEVLLRPALPDGTRVRSRVVEVVAAMPSARVLAAKVARRS